MSLVYFPLDCHSTNVRVTTNFGEPYPQDAFVDSRTNFYINKVVNYFRMLKSYENNFNNNSMFPLLSLYLPSLQSYQGRVNLLKYLAERRYATTTFPDVLINMNSAYLSLFPNNNHQGYLQNISFHPGLDMTIINASNTVGKPVYAVTDGVVRKASSRWCRDGGCGGFLVLQHFTRGTTFYALYGHVTPIVAVGATVVGGSIIANVANITSFPPHLHFEITTRYIYDQYPSYPYKQYYLSGLLLGAYLFDYNSTASNPRIDLNSSVIQIPYAIYRGMIVSQSWDIKKSEDVSLSAFFRERGFVDPINFLQRSCNNKIYSASTRTACLPFNFIDDRCYNDICVALRK